MGPDVEEHLCNPSNTWPSRASSRGSRSATALDSRRLTACASADARRAATIHRPAARCEAAQTGPKHRWPPARSRRTKDCGRPAACACYTAIRSSKRLTTETAAPTKAPSAAGYREIAAMEPAYWSHCATPHSAAPCRKAYRPQVPPLLQGRAARRMEVPNRVRTPLQSGATICCGRREARRCIGMRARQRFPRRGRAQPS